jgi:hypothetical protein
LFNDPWAASCRGWRPGDAGKMWWGATWTEKKRKKNKRTKSQCTDGWM